MTVAIPELQQSRYIPRHKREYKYVALVTLIQMAYKAIETATCDDGHVFKIPAIQALRNATADRWPGYKLGLKKAKDLIEFTTAMDDGVAVGDGVGLFAPQFNTCPSCITKRAKRGGAISVGNLTT